MSRVVVGVDAGGTQTDVAVERDGEVVFSLGGPPANPQTAGVANAVSAIAQAIRAALDGSTPRAISVGAAGAGRPETASALLAGLTQAFPGVAVEVGDDAHLALRAAVPHGDGVALIAGTGSIACGEIRGRRYRAGGYGYALGDEGSGYAIGAAALKVLLRAYDGRGPRDRFVDAIAERLGAKDAGEVLSRVYNDRPVATIASIASLVVELADAGERGANKIVQAAALELFELVRAVWRMADIGSREIPIAFAGGLLSQNSLLTYLVEGRIANEMPHAYVVKNAPSPVNAALAEARALAEAP